MEATKSANQWAICLLMITMLIFTASGCGEEVKSSEKPLSVASHLDAVIRQRIVILNDASKADQIKDTFELGFEDHSKKVNTVLIRLCDIDVSRCPEEFREPWEASMAILREVIDMQSRMTKQGFVNAQGDMRERFDRANREMREIIRRNGFNTQEIYMELLTADIHLSLMMFHHLVLERP